MCHAVMMFRILLELLTAVECCDAFICRTHPESAVAFSESFGLVSRQHRGLEFFRCGYTSEGELDKGNTSTSLLFVVIL